MINDYTKEVGLPSQKKTVPRPVAWVILGLVAVGVSFGVAEVIAQTRTAEKKNTPPAQSAPAATGQVPAPAPEPAPAPAPAETK